MRDADTDSNFYYTIIGTKGTTSPYVTNNPGNDKERGKTDTYTFTDSADIGEFRCVSIEIGGRDGWLITEVRLSIFYFLINFSI